MTARRRPAEYNAATTAEGLPKWVRLGVWALIVVFGLSGIGMLFVFGGK